MAEQKSKSSLDLTDENLASIDASNGEGEAAEANPPSPTQESISSLEKQLQQDLVEMKQENMEGIAAKENKNAPATSIETTARGENRFPTNSVNVLTNQDMSTEFKLAGGSAKTAEETMFNSGMTKDQIVSYATSADANNLHSEQPVHRTSLTRNAAILPPGEPGAYAIGTEAPGYRPRYHPTSRSHQSLNNISDHHPASEPPSQIESQQPVALDAALVESSTRLSLDDADEEAMQPARPPRQPRQSSVQTLIEAQVLPERTSEERRAKKLFLYGFVVAAIMVLLLGVVLGTGGSDSEDASTTTAITNTPTSSLYPPFQYDLPQSTLKAINHTNSPQYKANVWMMEDPNLQSYPQERQLQRFALVTFYYGTLGENWTHQDHWLDYDVSECDWFTQSKDPICDDDSNLIKVDLHSNNLQGTIPKESQYIPHLIHSDLSYNSIGGPTPNFVTNNKLQVLRISHNHFAGPLVGDAGFSAFGLEEISMDGNAFYGNIAPIYQFLPRLTKVNLTSNRFTGSLPRELKYATHLQYVGLGHNGYMGSIPSELGILTNLQGVDLSGNRDVLGLIPTELQGMSSLQLLDVSETAITGQLPGGLCELLEANEAELVADCSNETLQCCSY